MMSDSDFKQTEDDLRSIAEASAILIGDLLLTLYGLGIWDSASESGELSANFWKFSH